MFRILFLSIWFVFHPVHVTLTSIDYIPASDLFKVFVRFYFDDFISDYKLNAGNIENIDFTVADSSSISMMAMEKYLSEKVVIKVNEKLISGKLLNMKLTDNEVSMNLEYKALNKPKTITVKNLLMTGLYADMSNMIIVKINDFEEGFRLTSDLTEKTFQIK